MFCKREKNLQLCPRRKGSHLPWSNISAVAGINGHRKTIRVRADKTHKITISPDEAYILNADSKDFKKKYRTLPE